MLNCWYVCYVVEVGDEQAQGQHDGKFTPRGNVGIRGNRRIDVAGSDNRRHNGGSDCGICTDTLEKQAVTLAAPTFRLYLYMGMHFGVSPCFV